MSIMEGCRDLRVPDVQVIVQFYPDPCQQALE
jgi:hypothetical protein